MGWFDPNTNSTTPDLSSFNYGTEAEKIKRKRAAASMLIEQGMTPDRGQVVPGGPNGFYVGQTPLGVVAKLLMTYMGKKGLDQADADSAALDKNSVDALTAVMADRPWESKAEQAQLEREAAAELERESRRGTGVEAGESVATPMPVRDAGPIETRPLDAPKASTKAAAKALGAGAGRGFVNPPLVSGGGGEFRGSGASGSWDEPAPAKPLGRAQAAQRAAREASRQRILATEAQMNAETAAKQLQTPSPQPMPAQAAAPAPTARVLPDLNAQPTPAPVPTPQPAYAGDGGPRGDSRSMVDQAKAAAQPTLAEQAAYFARLSQTGPMGKQLADAGFQQLFGPKANEYEFKNVKQGDNEVLVAINKRNPRDARVVYTNAQGGPSVAQQNQARDNDKFAMEASGKVSEAQTSLDQAVTQRGKVQNAIELISKYAPTGGVWSNVTGAVGRFLGNDAANEIDMALKELAFSDLKATFGGNPTEGERKAQEDIKASIGRGTAPSIQSLNTMLAGIERRVRLHTNEVQKYQGFYDQYRTQPGQTSAPAGNKQFMYSWQK